MAVDDFSTLSPLRFLGSGVSDPESKDCISKLSQHFATNLRHPKKCRERLTNFDLTESLSAYASEETAEILNGK